MSFKLNEETQEDFYYEAISRVSNTILVLGERPEQWTSMTLDFFERHRIPVSFFDWNELTNLRLQLELTRYPVIQLWIKGNLIEEIHGYHNENLRRLIAKYYSA